MKATKLVSFAIGVCLMTAMSGGLSAQTKAPAKKTAAAKRPAAAKPAFDPALLKPATLTAKAPDTFDVKFATTKGDFVVRVTRAWSPLGADRFYNLVKHGYYNQASLFRAVPNFVVQFGISAYPQVSQAWLNSGIKDEPVKHSNKRGTLTFATSGPNARTTQVFVNLNDANVQLDGMGFTPFGEVVEGMDVVDQFYNGYGEATRDRQGEIYEQGNAFLAKNFPKLDSIKTATVVSGEPATPEPAAKAPAKKAPAKKAPAKKPA